ncbi:MULTISPECIES: GNAT family N-acetyltransferase [unclassified Curtobacterium]|uniref:GNAT family N-acetyltransferase n=1 Tax=unclassified Curtobacterium TaxID=257496 RepID=UPI0008DE79C2|nr:MULTISPECIES: GNAT family N-acetyltransferase [unclassified Curtobacterium]OIH99900.1 GNAT family N-acetyltransferase [Curtobacterium sp. MCBA15_003]OII30879.1 GNAT family N-acetyltransferase [Curtobacterium sp. MMLR14_006]
MLDDLALPVLLTARSGTVTLRNAVDDDLDALVALLADDPVSAARGDVAAPGDRPRYAAALRSVVDDPANALLVVEDETGRLVGTLQLTRIPGMARRGARRLLVEAVRVSSTVRSGGIGTAVMRWVTDVAAPALDTPLVQLTSDAARTDAHRFYERLGFTGSHVGFKYRVPGSAPGAAPGGEAGGGAQPK